MDTGYNDMIIKWMLEWKESAKSTGSKMEFVFAKVVVCARNIINFSFLIGTQNTASSQSAYL